MPESSLDQVSQGSNEARYGVIGYSSRSAVSTGYYEVFFHLNPAGIAIVVKCYIVIVSYVRSWEDLLCWILKVETVVCG